MSLENSYKYYFCYSFCICCHFISHSNGIFRLAFGAWHWSLIHHRLFHIQTVPYVKAILSWIQAMSELLDELRTLLFNSRVCKQKRKVLRLHWNALKYMQQMTKKDDVGQARVNIQTTVLNNFSQYVGYINIFIIFLYIMIIIIYF